MKSIRENGKLYSIKEEFYNGLSHGIGAMLAIVGGVFLIYYSIIAADVWKIVSSSIYAFSLILLLTMSTLYHSITNDKLKSIFRVFDHMSISLLIAGTYTPLMLVTLRGALGWTIISIVWAVNLVSIALNLINVSKYDKANLVCYIISGWCVVIALIPIFKMVDLVGIALLTLGGIMYTTGIVFYKKHSVKYMHCVWHIFVVLGAAFHYFFILFYVILN